MKKLIWLGLIAIFVLAGCNNTESKIIVTNFEECIAAGNPAMESHPRQCRHDDVTYTEILPEPELTNIFKHEKFTLTLPTNYDPTYLKERDRLKPLEGDAFPEIAFSARSNEEKVVPADLIEYYEESFNNLCTQTSSCPEIIDQKESIQYDEIPGVYMLTEDTAPPIGDTTDTQFGHHYVFAQPDDLVYFRVYEYGQEPSNEFAKNLESIISTLQFTL
jgi:hypothetical protein